MSSFPEQTTPERVVRDTISVHPASQATSQMRVFFLDHLRAALTILVVLHHLAVIYGATTVFYYVEPPGAGDTLAGVVFAAFVLINQAYFMGLFFLISGYFTPGSFDRKGPGAFFRRFFNRQSRFGCSLSQQAFPVYIIHIPAIVLLALALRGGHPEALLKFALAALIGVPLSFALAFLVRKIPFVSKLL